MKSLTNYLNEKLIIIPSQVNEKLVINKNYDPNPNENPELDELWEILSNDSSLSWAGSICNPGINVYIRGIITYIIHGYGRFKQYTDNTYYLAIKIWDEYRDLNKYTEQVDDKTNGGYILLNMFNGVSGKNQEKLIKIIKKLEIDNSIKILDKNDNNYYSLDILENNNYLVLLITQRSKNSKNIKTCASVFILKKLN